jgi:hypothetical protein
MSRVHPEVTTDLLVDNPTDRNVTVEPVEEASKVNELHPGSGVAACLELLDTRADLTVYVESPSGFQT